MMHVNSNSNNAKDHGKNNHGNKKGNNLIGTEPHHNIYIGGGANE